MNLLSVQNRHTRHTMSNNTTAQATAIPMYIPVFEVDLVLVLVAPVLLVGPPFVAFPAGVVGAAGTGVPVEGAVCNRALPTRTIVFFEFKASTATVEDTSRVSTTSSKVVGARQPPNTLHLAIDVCLKCAVMEIGISKTQVL